MLAFANSEGQSSRSEPDPDPVPPRAGAPQISRPKLKPLSSDRYALQVTIASSTHDKLCELQALLRHAIPSGDVAQVLDRAFDALKREIAKKKFGEARRNVRPTKTVRHVPARIRAAVWGRDGGRCTFVSDSRHRCEERRFLEFDHVEPVALGGRATVGNIRQRCRAHNQLEADLAFGEMFMERKRAKREISTSSPPPVPSPPS